MPPAPRKSFALRLDPALHAAIERMAAGELRSVNAQIEFMLREALFRRGVRIPGGAQPGAGGEAAGDNET